MRGADPAAPERNSNKGVMINPTPKPRRPEKKPENIPVLKTKTDMFNLRSR